MLFTETSRRKVCAMRRLLGLLVLLGAVGAHAEDLSFVGGTDKNPLDYKLNETITFTVTLIDRDKDNAPVTGRALRWTLAHDDRKLDRNGTATSDAPLVLSTALASPGFVRLKVEVEDNGAWLSGNTQVFDGYGFGATPLWCGRFGGGAYAAPLHGPGRPACRYCSRRHRPVFPLKGCCA